MPSRHPRSSAHTPADTSPTEDPSQTSWDGNAAYLGSFLSRLPLQLRANNSAYDLLVRSGVVYSGRNTKILTDTIQHALDHRDGLLPTSWGWASPSSSIPDRLDTPRSSIEAPATPPILTRESIAEIVLATIAVGTPSTLSDYMTHNATYYIDRAHNGSLYAH
jgi:hypothetical protein